MFAWINLFCVMVIFVDMSMYVVIKYVQLQNKDLKSRILHLEGSYRSSKEGLVAQMEARITELEERLENEERWN